MTGKVSNLTSVQSQRTASFAYNGDGLRTSKTVNNVSEGFNWAFVGGLPVILQDAGTAFIYGPGGVPIEQVSSTGATTYMHQDQLGSTRVITDASGSVAGTYTYGAYGSTTSHTGTAITPLQFAGQYLDSETGLYYMRMRYYDPGTGQFTSRDPFVPATAHPYSYVDGNPLNGVDPLGLFSLTDILPYAGLISDFFGGLALAFGAALVLEGVTVVLEVVSTIFGVIGAIYDCKTQGFNLNCAVNVVGAALGAVGLVARAGSFLLKLPGLLAAHNLGNIADEVLATVGFAKLRSFANAANRLTNLTEGWGFKALTAALTAVDEFLAYLDIYHKATATC